MWYMWSLTADDLRANTTGIILSLVVALILHLVEEVTTGFRKRFPLGDLSIPIFVAINVAFYAFCFVTLVLSAREGELATPFAWVFAVTMVLNGLGHVGMMALRRQYFPGGLTAVLLLGLSVHLMLHLLGLT